ncbi:MAG: GNAT family N-acetyltransferase, partial [Lachnospiraceae bacterium]|nr:GNAT family N-acetyltransferase [Lachnospiraceae bacterium]
MNIFAINTLTLKQFYDARELIALCGEFDGTRGVSFLEPELNEDRTFPAFYMMYDNAKLISFVSVFLADEEECEIYGYTMPECRNKGYFKRLYKEALKNLKAYSYKRKSY